MEPPTVVIDNGTGYSKMGYAGNLDPSYLIPSTIAYSLNKVSLVVYIIFYRKILNLRTLRWIIISEKRLWLNLSKRLIKSAIYWRVVKSKTGKVLRSSGIKVFTHISGASLKSIGLFSQSHQWILPRIESKWRKLCLRHSVWRDCL